MKLSLILIPGAVAPGFDMDDLAVRSGVYIEPINLHSSDLFREGRRSHTLVFGPTWLGGAGMPITLDQGLAGRGSGGVEVDSGLCAASQDAPDRTSATSGRRIKG